MKEKFTVIMMYVCSAIILILSGCAPDCDYLDQMEQGFQECIGHENCSLTVVDMREHNRIQKLQIEHCLGEA